MYLIAIAAISGERMAAYSKNLLAAATSLL
jgi:hypothetical protein